MFSTTKNGMTGPEGLTAIQYARILTNKGVATLVHSGILMGLRSGSLDRLHRPQRRPRS
jgi:hypothetical protein